MPLRILRADITTLSCDAVVNAANSNLSGGGGVDGAIHRAAGPKLQKACAKLGGCLPGHAVITRGYDLPAHYVIHTVGPVWQGGAAGEEQTLAACYDSSLALAHARRLRSVAFPLISAGSFGFPKDLALRIAMDRLSAFLLEHEMDLILVVYDSAVFQLSRKLRTDIESYIDETYVREHRNARESNRVELCSAPQTAAQDLFCADYGLAPAAALPRPAAKAAKKPASLEEALRSMDESFSQMLLRKIDEKGMTDVACYKKANVDRKLFSKIRSNPQYKPSKPTALAFAVALELDLVETRELLFKAGYALSHSSKFDVIIEFFISRGVYDIYQINEALFAFDQSLLGA